MKRALLLAALAALVILARRPPAPQPEPEPEGDEGVQPADPRPVYLVTLGRGDPRIGTFSRN